ncbi:MAG: alanine--tRNA ligase [Candidatus Gracilibacteria bacterium]|nr:alanine--tRNA ligase [Candidatus Gracilibacteria bacterium]
MLTAKELRQKYIDFFVSQGHKQIQSASLVPAEDPTVLFTTAGMHPLVPYLMGEKHPEGVRLVNYQKCVRTGDIDEVGDASHLTFFEMLGNWSMGDYFKKEAITWSFQFLTEVLEIPLEKLAFTCFEGDDDCPRDDEAANVWKSLGVPEERIFFLPKKDNWWGPAGTTGPCGPDTEMFFIFDPKKFDEVAQGTKDGFNAADDQNLMVEVWNDVFMQYNKQEDGSFVALEQKNVDTGMGLERILCVLNGFDNVYETELFKPTLDKIKELATVHDDITSLRIVSDHARTMTFMAGDHVRPSNMGQGYVMRRIMRRAIRHGMKIGIQGHFLGDLSEIIIDQYSDIYPELSQKKEEILKAVRTEEEQFTKTLAQGMREFEKVTEKLREAFSDTIDGQTAFHLYDTYGFPIEMTSDLATENSLKVDLEGFQKAFEQHQELSRTASAGQFAGGLSDHSDESKRLHTATHLLHTALKKVLGDHVEQRGSNINAERLRFDFTHEEKMTPEQKEEVEKMVNDAILAEIDIHFKEMSFDDAKAAGAIGLFEDKYGDKVKVYFMGDYSTEVCGGPHVSNTRELGGFKIKKEQSSSAGVRRIKATVAANQE